jgi:ABC-type uncharacterized transport system permease subunit
VNELAVLIASTLNAGTALALAALGLLVNERSGIVNLGAEGMMLVAAIAGFATGVETGSDTRWASGCWSSGSTPTSTRPASR